MHWFHTAYDYYTSTPLAQQLAWEIGVALIFLVIAFAGLHLLRRAFRLPRHGEEGELPPGRVAAFERFAGGGRLYHWGNFAVIAGLLISGAAFFYPGVVFPIGTAFGFSWLLVHVILAWIFVAFVIVHIFYGVFETGLRDMFAFHGHDVRDFMRRVGFYLGGRGALPRHGKFDAFQKIYHILLIVFAIVMIGTGISLFLSSMMFATLDGNWLRWQRIFHDIFAFLFLAFILGHIYLRLLRTRWPKFVSMITGSISRRDFEREYDWRRWQPESGKHAGIAESASAAGPHDHQED